MTGACSRHHAPYTKWFTVHHIFVFTYPSPTGCVKFRRQIWWMRRGNSALSMRQIMKNYSYQTHSETKQLKTVTPTPTHTHTRAYGQHPHTCAMAECCILLGAVKYISMNLYVHHLKIVKLASAACLAPALNVCVSVCVLLCVSCHKQAQKR